jgi:phosphoribosylaminoimidazole carboxylase PurK protein
MSQTETIGIVGGGQLGRMLTEAATAMGLKVVVVEPIVNCPAKQAGATQIVAALDDKAALQKLAKMSDVITIEIEHVDSTLLEEIATLGKSVEPSPATIKMIQDKFAQKQFLASAGIPVADFVSLTTIHSAEKALEDFGGKMIIKTRYGAYDGRGNMVVNSPTDIAKAFEVFEGQKLYAEKFVPFQKELAIMIARGKNGEIATYPVVETIQKRNICTEVIAPAVINEAEAQAAEELAVVVAHHLRGLGVFGIELFLTNDGKVLVNEIAPRVHNSGHYTIEACATSQFTQHIRAITGMPLGATNLIVPAAVMVNILGERNGVTIITGLEEAQAISDTTVHLYGKSPTKIDRKMGHITATAASIKEARERAERARGLIGI